MPRGSTWTRRARRSSSSAVSATPKRVVPASGGHAAMASVTQFHWMSPRAASQIVASSALIATSLLSSMPPPFPRVKPDGSDWRWPENVLGRLVVLVQSRLVQQEALPLSASGIPPRGPHKCTPVHVAIWSTDHFQVQSLQDRSVDAKELHLGTRRRKLVPPLARCIKCS